MSELLKISEGLKKTADNLLKRTGLVRFLSLYGTVHFTGAYAADVMMHGDIDIYVVRTTPFTVKEVFEIFRKLYFEASFRSYFIMGDWDDPRKGNKFPNGHYIGLKERVDGERWKIDVWFMSDKEYGRQNNDFRIEHVILTPEQKEKILFLKKERNKKQLTIIGQDIYKAVLEHNISTIEELLKYTTDSHIPS